MIVLCQITTLIFIQTIRITKGLMEDGYRQPSSLQSYSATQPLYITGDPKNPPMAANERYGYVYTNVNDPTKIPQDRHLKWLKVFSKKKKKQKTKLPKIFKKCKFPPVGITVIKGKPGKHHYHDDDDDDDDDDDHGYGHDQYVSFQAPSHYDYFRRRSSPNYPIKKRNYQVHEDIDEHPTFYNNKPNLMYEKIPPFKPIKGPIPHFNHNGLGYRRPVRFTSNWRFARPGMAPPPYVMREPVPGMYMSRPPQLPMMKMQRHVNMPPLFKPNYQPYHNYYQHHQMNPYELNNYIHGPVTFNTQDDDFSRQNNLYKEPFIDHNSWKIAQSHSSEDDPYVYKTITEDDVNWNSKPLELSHQKDWNSGWDVPSNIDDSSNSWNVQSNVKENEPEKEILSNVHEHLEEPLKVETVVKTIAKPVLPTSDKTGWKVLSNPVNFVESIKNSSTSSPYKGYRYTWASLPNPSVTHEFTSNIGNHNYKIHTVPKSQVHENAGENFESKKIVKPQKVGIISARKPLDVDELVNENKNKSDVVYTVTPTPVWSNSNFFEGLEQNNDENVGKFTTVEQIAAEKRDATTEKTRRADVEVITKRPQRKVEHVQATVRLLVRANHTNKAH